MARDTKAPTTGQTETGVTSGTSSTSTSTGGSSGSALPADLEQRMAALKADEERLAREKRAQEEAAANLKRQQEEVERREQGLEQRARELRAGAEHLDQRQAELDRRASEAPTVTATAAPSAPETSMATLSTNPRAVVRVLNNSGRIIGTADGTPLPPTMTTTIPLATWNRFFDRNGKPTPGASEHFSTAGGKRPDLQEVSLKNLSALPDDHALAVVEESEDTQLLAKFEETDPRDSVREAISRRLDSLKAKR